jgi:hypothetical protein
VPNRARGWESARREEDGASVTRARGQSTNANTSLPGLHSPRTLVTKHMHTAAAHQATLHTAATTTFNLCTCQPVTPPIRHTHPTPR